MSATAEETLIVEDSPTGVFAAHRIGARVIIVPDMLQPSKEILKLVENEKSYNNLFEVIDFLKKELAINSYTPPFRSFSKIYTQTIENNPLQKSV